jgi:hypothetical protein
LPLWIAYFTYGWPAAALTLLTPILSWIFWFVVLWIKFGIWRWYNIAVIIALIAGVIIGFTDDDQEESSQSPSLKDEESHDDL